MFVFCNGIVIGMVNIVASCVELDPWISFDVQ